MICPLLSCQAHSQSMASTRQPLAIASHVAVPKLVPYSLGRVTVAF